MNITVATIDRESRKIEVDLDVDYYQQGACEEQVLEAIRQGYLRGLEDAEKVRDDIYSCGGETGDDPSTFRRGHDAHGEACAELAKRLRKEIKG